ncbi:RNA-binding S4 domain-containing protein [Gimesia algae]|uniref:Ribosome-associated protein n=1 Tax=Gimesia algae TaxID=2527971 RepID=A0A517VEH4_9PLAN|nr:RNA-binding S4 domain-containing protein [Gimesia algae]QDT91387.1 ribosome-associated protein [Gimesia algae]
MVSDDRPPIRLDQFLKIQAAVGTGGHAKVVIQGGEVTVNGVVETRRRKQLSPGDIVAYAGEEWCVEVTDEY